MENIPFFDPYNFLSVNNMQNMKGINNTHPSSEIPQVISPKEFYENQYVYYRYLNEVLEYQMKKDEYDRKFKGDSTKSM